MLMAYFVAVAGHEKPEADLQSCATLATNAIKLPIAKLVRLGGH